MPKTMFWAFSLDTIFAPPSSETPIFVMRIRAAHLINSQVDN